MRLDTDKFKAMLGKFGSELRGSRLWPLSVVLLVAIVAVPIALSKSSSGTPVASAPVGTPPPPGSAVPALNVQTAPGKSRLPGHGRDPFAQQQTGGSGTSAAGAGTTAPVGASAGTGLAGGSASTSGGSSASSSGASGGSSASSASPPTSTPASPPSITPNKKPTPAPSGLTPKQSYDVTLAITNSAGGLDTLDPLERLSVLPSAHQPLLVELGVLKGGSRVLFAVQPGTVVGGPGSCTPGPIDCEILSLGQDQTEALSVQSPSGPVPVALFAVTGITAAQHPTASAADQARRQESAAGRGVLDSAPLAALSLFRYDASVGAIVDLRNLTAGDR